MTIESEISITRMIRKGSIFYFSEESFDTNIPHNYVILNNQPTSDISIVLLVAVTFDQRVYERVDYFVSIKRFPKETFVDVKPQDCSLFSKLTLFNCNNVFEKDFLYFVDKLDQGKLRFKGLLEESIVKRLVEGVKKSPTVTRSLKKLIE